MSTILHTIFDVVFGNVVFVIVTIKIHCQKIQFSTCSQNYLPEESIFGHFEVILLNV